jgi:hypothetical protein
MNPGNLSRKETGKNVVPFPKERPHKEDKKKYPDKAFHGTPHTNEESVQQTDQGEQKQMPKLPDNNLSCYEHWMARFISLSLI